MSPATDASGRTRIKLAVHTSAGSWVTLEIVKAPRDLVFLSPWDPRVQVPSFENKSNNYVSVVLAERGERALLENKIFLRAAMEQILKQAPPARDGGGEQIRDALAEVARIYGLPASDIDRAIRDWGQRTQDPYEKGLAALYQNNYSLATDLLSESDRMREAQADKANAAAADVTFYLGHSLYLQGKFREAEAAYRRADRRRPDDALTLNGLAMCLAELGDLAAAEPLYRRSLEIDQGRLGPEHPSVAAIKNNLAFLLHDKGDYAGAKQLFQEALQIDKSSLGAEHPRVAIVMSNLAQLLTEMEEYDDAEKLLQRALTIDRNSLRPDDPVIAYHLSNLGALLVSKDNYADAEPVLRRALAIDEKAGRQEHPDHATAMCNLATALRGKHDYAGAEELYRKALSIDQKALGPEHPNVARVLSAMGMMFAVNGDYAAAEPLLREALRIDEKASNYFNTSGDLLNLAALFRAKGDDKTRMEFLMREIKLSKEEMQKRASQTSTPPHKQP